ncbi:MAG TPA: hypothetical protein VK922_02520 [Gemmatimonadaceae bacterium]|nr:hypothetical protein [Gemmatimonadaceae bacterium]
MRHAFVVPASRLALLASVVALVGAGCVRQRDIFAPVPGALQRTVPDTSIATVLDAAALAITDRGITVSQIDREHGMVESDFVDIAAVRSDIDAGTAIGIERSVRFRFRAIPSFGAISLYGEAVYQLGDFGGRASERMVPEQHPAIPVLAEMLTSVEDRVAQVKAERNPPPPAR